MNFSKIISALIILNFVILSCVNKQNKTVITKNKSYSVDTMAAFREKIPSNIEKQYLEKFDSVANRNPNLQKKITLNYKEFKNLILKNSKYSKVKFFFIQENNKSKLNIGIAFSNNSEYTDISSDQKFSLSNNYFVNDEKLKDKINIYKSSLVKQIGINGNHVTECVIYNMSDIEKYFINIESKKNAILKLDFLMIYFCKAKEDDGSNYTEVSENKFDKISFAVHAIYDNGFTDIGYDAGDLKP